MPSGQLWCFSGRAEPHISDGCILAVGVDECRGSPDIFGAEILPNGSRTHAQLHQARFSIAIEGCRYGHRSVSGISEFSPPDRVSMGGPSYRQDAAVASVASSTTSNAGLLPDPENTSPDSYQLFGRLLNRRDEINGAQPGLTAVQHKAPE